MMMVLAVGKAAAPQAKQASGLIRGGCRRKDKSEKGTSCLCGRCVGEMRASRLPLVIQSCLLAPRSSFSWFTDSYAPKAKGADVL